MYLYVPNEGGLLGNAGGIFSAFKVDPATGALSVVPGSPFQAGEAVSDVAVDPAGRYVYVSSIINGSTGILYVFSVDPTTGSLTPLSGAPFPGAGGPIAIDPTGRFLYAGVYSYDLQVFSIDPVSGVPTPIAGSPFVFPGSEDYSNSAPFVIDPSGNFVYFQSSSISLINASINFETGVPTEVGVDPIPTLDGSTTAWVAMDPLDRFVALNGTEILTVSPTNNLLIPPPGATPTFGPSAFDPSGRFLYAQEYCPNPTALPCGPTALQVNPTTGALTPIAGPNFGSEGFWSPIVDLTDHYVYALGTNPSGTGEAIFGYSLDQTTGALTPLPSSPWPMSYSSLLQLPMAISFAPTGASNPVPSITSFSPATVTALGPGFTLTVNGSNFVPGSKVYFGGLGRLTTFVSPTQLTANIFPTDILLGGSAVVFVFNPLPVGGVSESVAYPVLNPTPGLISLSTTSVVAGSNEFTLSVAGTGFQPISVLTFNGAQVPTTYETAGELQTLVLNAQIALPGTISVGVTTPPMNGLGGGSSGTLPLTVTPVNLPPPVISQLAPGSTTAGGPSFPLLITGAGLASNSVVTFGSTTVPVINSALNGTDITVTIPASAITTPGTEPVVVGTAAGISSPVTFYIDNPSPVTGGVNPPVVPTGGAALTLNISGANFVMGSTVLVNGSARVTTFVSSSLLQATLLASDISHGGTLTITVSSPGPGGGLSAAITLPIADYALSAVNSTASITSGQVASYTLTIAPSNGAYANPVTFTASGLPAGASASFSSPTVTPGANPASVTFMISTTARSLAPPVRFPQWPVRPVPVVYLAGLALAFGGIGLHASKARLRRLAPQFLLATLLVMAASLVACSTNSGSASTQPGGPETGTPAGTYSVVVKATSGTDVHTTTVTLTVM